MKKSALFLLSLFAIVHTGVAQNAGKWSTHLAYHTTTHIVEGNNLVFALADGSLYSYDKEDKSIHYYSKQTGLHDNNITALGYNADKNTLIIGYANGNIDLLGDEGIINIPYIKTNTGIQKKTINNIYSHADQTYLATDFGIVVLNMNKKEVKETYFFYRSVYSVAIHADDIYAATSSGIAKGSLRTNLIDPTRWDATYLVPEPKDTIHQIAFFQNNLCFEIDKKGIGYASGGEINMLLSDPEIVTLALANDKLLSVSKNKLHIYSSFTEKETIHVNNLLDVSSLKNNTYWLAVSTDGIKGMKKGSSGAYETVVDQINKGGYGPVRNLDAMMLMHDQKLLIAGGGRWQKRLDNPGTLMVYEDNSWFNFDRNTIINQSGKGFSDVMSVAVDPKDANHYYASTWGEGVFEFKDNQFVKLHNHTNSTLSTAIQNNPYYIRVDGLCYDKENTLWMTNSGVENSIKIRKSDGTWDQLYYPDLSNKSTLGKIMISRYGQKWVNIPRDGAGVLIFDDKISNQAYKFYTTFYDAANNTTIDAAEYHCIVEDKKGEIWIATDKGPIIVNNPAVVFNDNSAVTCRRIVRSGDNGNNYFLNGVKINCIAVDGGNRKWIATEGAGVFLVNEDGSETIQTFTADNSPLLSDVVYSIAINDYTGEVFFGTNIGLVSYGSDATKGKESYSDVYAYPNPVRLAIDNSVHITGLMDNSNVKITDLNGNILYQGMSMGGQISWDCRNKGGKQVASGIYLVLSSTPNAKESVVTKIAIVK